MKKGLISLGIMNVVAHAGMVLAMNSAHEQTNHHINYAHSSRQLHVRCENSFRGGYGFKSR